MRLLLITTCTLVSFFHGSNDGQKGVGLLMLILIAFVPAHFAVNHNKSDAEMLGSLNKIEIAINHATATDAKGKGMMHWPLSWQHRG